MLSLLYSCRVQLSFPSYLTLDIKIMPLDSKINVLPLVLNVVQQVQELLMTLIKDFFRVDLLHVLDEELDFLNLFNDGFSFGLSCYFSSLFDEFVSSAAQKEYYVQLWVIFFNHSSQSQQKLDGP
jgi:hypothetical protein